MQFTFWEMQSYWKEVNKLGTCIYNQFYQFQSIFDAQRQDDYFDMQICLCKTDDMYTSDDKFLNNLVLCIINR